jgi:RNA 2',3'-cyclic 3'-phosphodiesterase
MRLFTGLAPDPHVIANLDGVLRELRPMAPLNWSPVENLHITSKFVGPWPEERLAELESALKTANVPTAFPVTVSGFGYFPNPHHPKAFFAGVEASAEVGTLARQIDEALAPLGVKREERPYTPHLTLARIRNENMRQVREHIAKMTNLDFGTFQASEFHLYLSRQDLNKSRSVYTKLATFPLGPQA